MMVVVVVTGRRSVLDIDLICIIITILDISNSRASIIASFYIHST